jgi:hypothetical protein
MEEKIFRLPDVFRVLKEGYVEARLHTDGSKNIERIKEKQAELTGSVATPIYVVLEPESEKVTGLFEGATFDSKEFERFLRAALEQAAR